MTPVLANVFDPLINILRPLLVFFHDDVGFGWGTSIVALTVIVRLAILPLTIRGIKGMNALRELQPQMKEIQEKYKNDRQRMNQEMMKFYRENKVNPLASCLPLLLQLPFFMALFFLLQDDLRSEICGQTSKPCDEVVPGSAEFFFIPDLTDQATGGVLIVLLILFVGSQMGASLVMSVSADKTQQRIFLLLPLVFAAFIPNFPAGLIVYWVTTNFWTLGQQIVVRKVAPPPHLATAAAVAGGGGGVTAPAKPPPPPPRKKKRRRR
jgi:YidC/Oxa1 family membrane protein insertase